ncbi:MAG: DUF2188 domain-containing protein [Methanotrichaceae archaeon]
MTKRKEHHVVPNDDGWAVKKSGAKRDTKHFDLKSDAVDFARDVSQNQGSELIIHGKDGKIQKSDSHGRDPNPPKDKK